MWDVCVPSCAQSSLLNVILCVRVWSRQFCWGNVILRLPPGPLQSVCLGCCYSPSLQSKTLFPRVLAASCPQPALQDDALPPSACVTMSKLPYLSGLQFACLEKAGANCSRLQGVPCVNSSCVCQHRALLSLLPLLTVDRICSVLSLVRPQKRNKRAQKKAP